ncbi:unnamed protein product [Peronospora belbahrii]|uniref:Uncharacterized protein n=1 Tax=Peronospora belbahrii TaxID=622444 RepID=A0AAU9KNW0_9STRA|nr:unnamed protein product [Peronospora belbahrii]
MALPTPLPDRVSYVEAYRRFVTLERSSTVVSNMDTRTYQDQLTQSSEYMKKCIYQRQMDGILSTNERFFELQNTQLYAFCIESYLGILLPKQSFYHYVEKDTKPQEQLKQMDEQLKHQVSSINHMRNIVDRVKLLHESDVFLTEYLNHAERVGLLTEKKRREQYERLESKQFSLSRDDKIQRFQMQREMEKNLIEIQKRRDEKKNIQMGNGLKEDEKELDEEDDDTDDMEREELMTYIQLSVLKYTDKQDLFSEAHRPPPPPQGQGLEVTRINPQLEMRRETIRSGVFKPGHRLPTMTLNEYADHEVANAVERQIRGEYGSTKGTTPI